MTFAKSEGLKTPREELKVVRKVGFSSAKRDL